MIREIVLEKGKSQVVPDDNGNVFKIKRYEEGYVAYDEYTEYGPFERVFVDFRPAGSFLCGFDQELVCLYNSGYSGLEEIEIKNAGKDMKKTIRQIRVERELKSLPNCKFLGEVEVYTLKYAPNDPFVKKDGYVRDWQENSCRHIFETEDGKVFAVNPNKPVRPIEEYKKYDTYEELALAVQSKKKLEYKNFGEPFNRHLQTLYNHVKEVRCLPDKLIHKILQVLKSELGLEEFRCLRHEIKFNIANHTLFDTEEMYEALKCSDREKLDSYVKEKGGIYRTQAPVSRAGVTEMLGTIPSLPSTCRYREISMAYGEKKISITIPDNEKVRQAKENPKLYEWKSISQFEADNPPYCKEIISLQEGKMEELRLKYLCEKEDGEDLSQPETLVDPLLETVELL